MGVSVTYPDQRRADTLPESHLQRIVSTVAERLIRIHVTGDVRIELPAGGTRAGSRPIDIDAHLHVHDMRSHISRFRREGGGKFLLDEEIPGLNISPVHVLREGDSTSAGQISTGGGSCGRLDGADGDTRVGWRRDAVCQRHLRYLWSVGNADVIDELVCIRRAEILVDYRWESIPLVTHVIGIDGNAVAAPDHGFVAEAIRRAEAWS